MRRIQDKRGAEMTVGTIVVIVLALLVLVLLALGFTMGFGNLKDRIVNIFNPQGSNVETIRQSCSLACELENKYDFCSVARTVKLQEGSVILAKTEPEINTLKDLGVTIDKGRKTVKGTCEKLNFAPELLIEKCEAISCEVEVTCEQKGGKWVEGTTCKDEATQPITDLTETKADNVCCQKTCVNLGGELIIKTNIVTTCPKRTDSTNREDLTTKASSTPTDKLCCKI